MKIDEIDTDFAWGAFGMLLIAAAVILFITFVAKDHQVTRYYAASGGGELTCRWNDDEKRSICNSSICIWADIPWMADSKAFCTTEVDKALEQLKQLNQTLK